jgi:hypothetical protein
MSFEEVTGGEGRELQRRGQKAIIPSPSHMLRFSLWKMGFYVVNRRRENKLASHVCHTNIHGYIKEKPGNVNVYAHISLSSFTSFLSCRKN